MATPDKVGGVCSRDSTTQSLKCVPLLAILCVAVLSVGVFAGVVGCFLVISVVHFALSSLPVHGKLYDISTSVILVGTGAVMTLIYLYLRQKHGTWYNTAHDRNPGQEHVREREHAAVRGGEGGRTRVGSANVTWEQTDESGNDFGQSLATRPLRIAFERDGRSLDTRKATACTARTLTGIDGPYRL